MAQGLRTLADLAEDPTVISSSAQTSVTAASGGPTLLSGRQRPQAYEMHMHTCRKNTHTHTTKVNL